MFMIIKYRNKILFYIIISVLICFIFLFFYKLSFKPSSCENMEFRVVIDPGHGSIDTGTYYQDIYEKNINLSIARFLEKEFKTVNIIPIMTRKEDKLYNNDRNEDLRHRPEIAKSYKADLYISLHVNNFPSHNPQGSQVFYKPGSKKSKELAENIKEKLVDLNRTNNREIISGNFYVLNNVPCPAVLIEAGFLSNPVDRKNLTNISYQMKFARAIKDGTVNYLQKQLASLNLEVHSTQTDEFYRARKVYYLQKNELSLAEQNFIYPAGSFLKGNMHKLNNTEIKAQALLTQLITPPENYLSVLPSSTEIKEVIFKNNTLTVNFSDDLIKDFKGGAGLELLTVKAIKKTLFSLPDIKEIIILIENEKNQSIAQHIVLNKFQK